MIGIDKTQLLDVVARLKGFDSLWDKIFDDIRKTSKYAHLLFKKVKIMVLTSKSEG